MTTSGMLGSRPGAEIGYGGRAKPMLARIAAIAWLICVAGIAVSFGIAVDVYCARHTSFICD